MTPLLYLAGGVCLLSGAGALLMLRGLSRRERMMERLLAVRLSGEVAAPRMARTGPLSVIARVGTAMARSGVLSTGTIAQLELTLTSAGLRGGNGLGLFVGFKLLLFAGLPSAVWIGLQQVEIAPMWRTFAVLAAAIAGLLLPDYFVRSRRAVYLKRLQGGLPDALDMMLICSEAGLGMEPAIARVAAEIVQAHPAVAEELSLTVSELRVAADRRTALMNMGARTELESLKRLGTTLIQTLQYGTPLSQALRILSNELRQEMLLRFEERAARLPVLITVPMIVFILPTIFIIVGGPAILQVYGSFRN